MYFEILWTLLALVASVVTQVLCNEGLLFVIHFSWLNSYLVKKVNWGIAGTVKVTSVAY